MTSIYINSAGGRIYKYDSANWSLETVVVANTGAFSISSGPAANTLYLQISNFNSGPLDAYDVVTRALTSKGGSVPGNAFGEGRDGFLYAGSGTSLYRIDPSNGSATHVGDGTYGFAGDIAVDPTTDVMYGAVEGRWGVELAILNRTTGGQTTVGALGVSTTIWGLGFSMNGDLFAAGPNSSGGGSIYRINKATGAATSVRSLNYEPYDMATQPYTVNEDVAGGGAGGAVSSGGSGPAVAFVGGGTYFAESFDGAPTRMRVRGTELWEAGTPSAGPGGAASGATCLATRTWGGYPAMSLEAAETPSISLAAAERPMLAIRHWYDLAEGADGAVVRVRTPEGDVVLEPTVSYPGEALPGLHGAPGFTGRSRGWVESSFDLSRWRGRADVRIAFTLGSSDARAAGGWFIDDILVGEAGAVLERGVGRAAPGRTSAIETTPPERAAR